MSRHEKPSAVLPASMPLLLCSRLQAAALLNVGPSTFDKLRKANPLLRPVQIGSRPLWPLKNLMAFVDELIDADTSAADDVWASATA
ncbi:MAG: hypothetical protein ACK4TP_07975 [Hyphomicrobium sp.]